MFIKVPIKFGGSWTDAYININSIIIIVGILDNDDIKRRVNYSNNTKSLIFTSNDSYPFECSLSADEVDILILNA